MKQAELERHKRSKMERLDSLKETIRQVETKMEHVRGAIDKTKREIDRVKRESRQREKEQGGSKADHPIRNYAVFFWNAYAIPLWKTLTSLSHRWVESIVDGVMARKCCVL